MLLRALPCACACVGVACMLSLRGSAPASRGVSRGEFARCSVHGACVRERYADLSLTVLSVSRCVARPFAASVLSSR